MKRFRLILGWIFWAMAMGGALAFPYLAWGDIAFIGWFLGSMLCGLIAQLLLLGWPGKGGRK